MTNARASAILITERTKGVIQMVKYVVTAYKVYEEFATEVQARKWFEMFKENFRYCELKKVTDDAHGWYAESLAIYIR